MQNLVYTFEQKNGRYRADKNIAEFHMLEDRHPALENNIVYQYERRRGIQTALQNLEANFEQTTSSYCVGQKRLDIQMLEAQIQQLEKEIVHQSERRYGIHTAMQNLDADFEQRTRFYCENKMVLEVEEQKLNIEYHHLLNKMNQFSSLYPGMAWWSKGVEEKSTANLGDACMERYNKTEEELTQVSRLGDLMTAPRAERWVSQNHYYEQKQKYSSEDEKDEKAMEMEEALKGLEEIKPGEDSQSAQQKQAIPRLQHREGSQPYRACYEIVQFNGTRTRINWPPGPLPYPLQPSHIYSAEDCVVFCLKTIGIAIGGDEPHWLGHMESIVLENTAEDDKQTSSLH